MFRNFRALFGKTEATDPEPVDLRLTKLDSEGFTCRTCGSRHHGLFDLAFDKPEQWSDLAVVRPNAEAHKSKHVLTEDFCILDGEHYFVRCVLELPIIGNSDKRFGYGVWSTLSKTNFEKYLSDFDVGHPADSGPWFGWMSNSLKGFPQTVNMRCQVFPQPKRQRPLIELEPDEHPLSIAQLNGISVDRIFELYKLNGHDFG
jgi:hypothetical protein